MVWFERESKSDDMEHTGREVGSVLRYLNVFPTEYQLQKEVHVELTALGADAHFVSFEIMEAYAKKAIAEKRYEPDSDERIFQAFKTLDVDSLGHLTDAVLIELLQSGRDGLNAAEIEDFLSLAKDQTTGFIHYEEYVYGKKVKQ